MKRAKNLMEKVLNINQIKKSIIDCAKHKMNRKEVKAVMDDLDTHAYVLYTLLATGSFEPREPHRRTRYDPCGGKYRDISSTHFYPEACVQRLLVDVSKDSVFMRKMYPHSCASIPNRGIRHAKEYVEKALKNNKRKTRYAVKLDITKYYPSINPDLVKEKLLQHTKDKEFVDLVYKVITCDSAEPGLAIGFYINQWIANFILEDLDWKISQFDGVRFYVRNMDDMVLIGSNKRKLRKAVEMIEGELEKMELKLKPNHDVFTIDEIGLDFVGFRFFHGFTILRRRNSLRLMRRIQRIKKKQEKGEYISFREAAGLLSLLGQLKHVANYTFNDKYVSMIDTESLKDIVRKGKVSNGLQTTA